MLWFVIGFFAVALYIACGWFVAMMGAVNPVTFARSNPLVTILIWPWIFIKAFYYLGRNRWRRRNEKT